VAGRGDGPGNVVVVGAEAALDALGADGLLPRPFAAVEPALEALAGSGARAVVVAADVARAPERDVDDVVRACRRAAPLVPVFVWAPAGEPALVRGALRAGARDVVLEGEPEALARAVREALSEDVGPASVDAADGAVPARRFEGMVSRSPSMWEVFETAERVAPTDATALILGETGTGKELLARAIHARSGRGGQFVAVNCGGIPEALVESELFGHEEGSFTGATSAKLGLFRHADGGTLFLDEVGNLPPQGQFSLLRVLQEGAVRPVGRSDELPVDVRVVAATSVPLDAAVQAQDFREDLLYRLDVIRLVLPPLRARPEDVLFLFGHFKRRLAAHHSVPAPRLSEGFLEAMLHHPWGGNVRELENFTERLLLTQQGKQLTRRHFRRLTRRYGAPRPADESGRLPRARPAPAAAAPDVDLHRTLDEHLTPVVEEVERRYLVAALRENRGRVQRTAEMAGLSRRTLLRKMKKYELDKSAFK